MIRQPTLGDVRDVGREATLALSVVCPFFNEEGIIREAITALLARLGELDVDWELIVVDDGSTDGSREIAASIARSTPNLRVLSYRFNRGRGHALKVGIAQARGSFIVTTEIDLSWGEDIVGCLYAAALENPDADVVVASPHMSGGGYRNVPLKRVLFSRLGNLVIRTCLANAVTMNTGMTRIYRRDAIRSLPLEENGKEFHLEVILKAQALGYRICEIPAVLEWKEYKHRGRRVARKSSSNLNRLVLTHSLFSLFGNPVRYVWLLGGISFAFSFGFLVAGVIRLLVGLVSVYMGILSLAFFILGIVLFAFGVVAQQANMIQRELWRLKQDLWESHETGTQGSTSSMAQPRATARRPETAVETEGGDELPDGR